MTTVRAFEVDDFYRIANINVDKLTETYYPGFYMHYMARWPDYFSVAESPSGQLMGYVLGKAEGVGDQWHGHVTAVTVAPTYRRIGIGRLLMDILESVSQHIYNAFFVDLYVRRSNVVAIKMYEKFGYIVYRTVKGYYSGEEDAYDMHKALPRDAQRASMVPVGDVTVDDLPYD